MTATLKPGELAARSDGKTLYVKQHGGENQFAWDGPTTAHHATILEGERTHHPYGSELHIEISVYDADGTFLGTLSTSEWS